MVHIDKVKMGLSRYLDSEILPKMSGWQKWVAGAGAAAYLAKADGVVALLKSKPELALLDLIDEANNIDIDVIYGYFKTAAHNCPATIENKIIGRITLTERDIDMLYECITRA